MQATSASLPPACSLSPGEYAERLREFRRLFAVALREVRRRSTDLHLVLDASTAGEAKVRDLLRREQACCPFFSFSVEVMPGTLVVEAAVPDGAEECLDDLERLAGRALAARV